MRISRQVMFSAAVTILAMAAATVARGQNDPSAPASAGEELRILSGLLTRPGVTLETRRDAAALLLAKGDLATPILAAALEKGDTPDLQMAVLQAIASAAEPPAGLLPALYKLSASETLAAPMQEPLSLALSAYRSREALRDTLDLLARSDSVRQKQILIAALGRIGEKEAVPPLIDLLDGNDPALRSSAAAALSAITQAYLGESHEAWAQWWQEHKDEPRGRWLFERLRAQEAQLAKQNAELDEVTRRLVEVHQGNLRKTEPAKRLGEIVKLLDDSLPALRQLAAAEARTLLRESKDPLGPLVDKLLARATDDTAAVREEVAATLASTKDKQASALLVERLSAETDTSVRAAVIKALGELREGQAVGGLVKLLDGGNETLMLRAIESLGQIGELGTPSAPAVEPALEPLAHLLDRNDKTPAGETVREAAARTLSRIARGESLPALIRALDDSAAKVRFFAAQGLGNVGKDNSKAIEALLNHLSDTDKGVRAAVADTLGRIGNGQAAAAVASRLGPGGETDKDVRQTLAGALLAIQRRSDDPQTVERLGDDLAALGDADSLKWAVQLYDLAVSKMGGNGNGHLAKLKEKLADASLRSGQANKAVTLLRELVEAEKDAARKQALQQKLGRVLITVPPYVEGVDLLVKAIKAAPAEERATLLQDIHDQTRRLKDEGKPADAYLIISRARRALGRTWSAGQDVAARMETLYLTVGRAVFDHVLQKLDAEDEAVRKQALDQATQVVGGEPQLLVTRLTQALTDADASRIARLEKLLPALGRDLAAYKAAATPEAKLAIVKTWGQAPSQEPN